ncbi:phosphatase PAP2 family protein [Herbivorax sp. ANBcel31]|uniref:phosphatase PAP2 family protein n=1 Tax=Herbivorax sp. ANBcel31 TaxID=3069754 RepID=UPI0027B5189D|nr:phosphatase PAP2 family protein [Herbivorax sp. ANBcel31]MDQ2085544.1 phosphatase PAP2 family protein [Herbivorax sp. ANBcel31]
MFYYIDKLFFFLLYNPAAENTVVGNMMVFITNWSSYSFAATYLIVIAFLLLQRSRKLIPVIFAPALTIVIVQTIRFFYLRPRPFITLEVDSLIYHAANGSLPSMHAASAFVIATAIWFIDKRIGKYVLILASMTAISRVMVGVHFPFDIILGAMLGVLLSIGVFRGTKSFVGYY